MPFRPLDKLRRSRRQKAAVRAFESISIRPGDIVIDGGANMGMVTLFFLGQGAHVLAYEPNPVAFRHLTHAFGEHPDVSCHPTALSDRNGTASLYMHRRDSENSLHYSEAASMLSDKRNVAPHQSIEIATVDASEAIHATGRRVRLLKLDIEGAEYQVLHRLIDTGAIHRIDHVFCETHAHKVPSLRRETRRLRQRLEREGIRHVNLDWI